MKKILPSIFFFFPLFLLAQKKPLDHTVYDGWQSIGERLISNDGKWAVYTVTPQEGDADLFIQSTDGTKYKKQVPRGYGALITEDSRYVVFKIRPLYRDTRDARIKKKRPEDFPKDSIGILELGNDKVFKVAKIKSFKAPEKTFGWLAYQKERDPAPARSPNTPTQRTVNSLRKTIDSLVLLVTQIKNVKGGNADSDDIAADDPVQGPPGIEGSDLVLRDLRDGKEKIFRNVVDYYFSSSGQKLVMRVATSARDSFQARAVTVYDLQKKGLDTILKGGNDFRNFALTEDGCRIAFLAERDTNKKALQRFYDLYLYRSGDDSAIQFINKHTVGMDVGSTVSENGNLSFSKTGNRLFFGTAPIQPPKDTSLIDIDLVKLDIWHYKDDYLQTQQLFQLNNDLRRTYLAMYDFREGKMEQLGYKYLPTIIQTNEGDGHTFIAVTDTGRRVQRQWGDNKTDVYALDTRSGKKTLVKKNHEGQVFASSTGKYILLYDPKIKNYLSWDGNSLKNITSKIRFPLYDERNDVPDDPSPYGLMGWHEGDSSVYIYDRYDVWRIDPANIKAPEKITDGRALKNTYRQAKVNSEERFLATGRPFYLRVFNETKKSAGVISYSMMDRHVHSVTGFDGSAYSSFIKAKSVDAFLFSKENYTSSPDLYFAPAEQKDHVGGWNADGLPAFRLTNINPQQSQYNWGTAELFKWKTFNGKEHAGILYKPEDFDSTKKYPMIMYFYETHSDGLYQYIPPTPTPSRLNISFYVSRGYVVLSPDIIYYTKGHPAKDAYNAVVSAAQALAKKKWIDSGNMAIQGQSWGGIQVAQLITMTNMFKAAWAGAPVANMTSAYGGIRWEGGVNRQFQYEKTQSRIGATLWERPELYIQNSPLFHVPRIKTPLVIMANDADGAVPWYQGIELFTAMRRLGKQVWMLNYNGEAHNLVERKNRKDIQIREQQYFDWLLKGDKPPRWITEGVPAVKKGRDWGFDLVEESSF